MNRSEILASLRNKPEISVLIIGAGINGIGTFRELAINGVDALIVDRGDFCSGASAASSHMAHGGIRYLENGEFRLVREAVRERNRLIKNAPHIVRPLPTTIPIFKYFSGIFNAPLKFFGWLDKPSERGSIIIKLGLLMYDAYTGSNRTVPRHRFLSRKASLNTWGKLNPAIVNTATYYDGLISCPERLAIEILLDGEAENHDARALNYMSMVNGHDGVIGLQDELTGDLYEVRPKLVINAAGPWIDIANNSLGLSTKYIGGTKGSHLVLNHPELREAIGDNEFFFENDDGRIVLIFPLFDRVLVGTSDIAVDHPDDAICTEDEVEYFLDMTKRVFPEIRITRDDIVFRFSGVRPLARSTAKSTGQYSRDHSIEVLSGDWTGLHFPVYSLVGGKWTSFRAFSEQVADKSLQFLGKKRIKTSGDYPIGGGRGFAPGGEDRSRQIDGFAAWTGLDRERLQVLYDRYGSRVDAVANFIKANDDSPLTTLPEFSKRELAFLVQYEKVVHIDDIILRRTMLAMLGRLTRESIEEIGAVAAEMLGWNPEREHSEIERTLQILAEKHGVRL